MSKYAINFRYSMIDPESPSVPLYYLYPEGRGLRIVCVTEASKLTVDPLTRGILDSLPFTLFGLVYEAASEEDLLSRLLNHFGDTSNLFVTSLGSS